MNDVYIRINDSDQESVIKLLNESNVDHKSTLDLMEFVADELTEAFIENNTKEELRPLFRENHAELSQWLLEEIDDVVDSNLAKDILLEYPLEDLLLLK